ncbi:MAG: prepilin-type N-terminal cleavage/methylation domain-containing protein [Candidatus Omnitrophica bacterium]|nr:prepilin-type N-terminal cleavage/methylation domain-containing protein [Candidatus Omnitrophota bacterium]
MIHFNRKKSKGFTLVEIMIVVAIIALIAAIAIPNLLRARHNANETSAIGNVRTLVAALESFRANQTPPAYPADLDELSSADPQYVPDELTDGSQQGYDFAFTQVSDNEYTLLATPTVDGVTGTRHFFVDQTGVIRVGDDDTGTPIE